GAQPAAGQPSRIGARTPSRGDFATGAPPAGVVSRRDGARPAHRPCVRRRRAVPLSIGELPDWEGMAMRATRTAWGRPLSAALYGIFLLSPNRAGADKPDFAKKTYTYKTVGEIKIQADVYRADDAELRPVVVWIHGGALINGSRNSVPKRLLDLCRSEGVALVSLDYRLAPEGKLPAIIEDVQDAFRWPREPGPRRRDL